MKILYAASEVAPFIKTGGLGDVAGSLPKALAAKGHEVAVICPLYCQIKPEWRNKMYYLRNLYVQAAWRSQYCGIFVYEADGVKYYFLIMSTISHETAYMESMMTRSALPFLPRNFGNAACH